MTKRMSALSPIAAGLAAAAVYFFDPVSGRRRRARVKDAAGHAMRDGQHFMDVAVRDLRNRMHGAVCEARYRRSGNGVDDGVLARRVSSKIGRCVSHPGAIEASAENGVVTLRGKVLRSELQRLVVQVGKVPGVRRVCNELDVYREAGAEPALQGGVPRGHRSRIERIVAAPSMRLLAMAGSGILAFDGMRRRGLFGLAEFVLASGAAARAAGVSAMPDVKVRKNLMIFAPPERVFAFFADQTRFPMFMRNVKEVRLLAGGHTRWTVRGPAGAPVTWDAATIRFEPNRLIAWRSEPGSIVKTSGSIAFRPLDEGMATAVDVRLMYRPPAGALGHFIAAAFGADPKHELDADLMLVKSFLETGRRPRHPAQAQQPLRM